MKTLLLSLIALFFISGISRAQSWNLTGNSGTDPDINFIGTKDKAALVFKVNNKKAGRLDFQGNMANTSLGYQSLFFNSAGVNNAAFGYKSLYSNLSGSGNAAVGSYALYNNFSDFNSALGSFALYKNTTGYSNTAV